MNIAVVMATRNGARTLPDVLDAHATLNPPQRIGLVVVDNGSTDETSGLLAQAPARWPQLAITVLHEPSGGKNRALNRSLPLVRDAELVAFTDDDAVPERDWLANLAAAAVQAPEYTTFGGTIRPRWMAPPPRWLGAWHVPLDICFAVNEGGLEGPVGAGRIWGPNMAVRGAVLRAGHRFAETVGPDGTPTYPMGSETEFTLRLERAGHRAWFAPRAVVHHLVRPEQMTEAWVLARAYRCGLGAARTGPWAARAAGAGPPAALRARQIGYRAAARLAGVSLPPSRLRFWLGWQAALVQGLADGLAGEQRR